MGEEVKGFGEQLYSRLHGKGLSKYQIDKVLALQRLDPEVADLGAKGLLADAQLLEISKITSAARQKQLAELTVVKNLPGSWVKALSKLIRNAEKCMVETEANQFWDTFFEIKEAIEKEGPTREIYARIRDLGTQRRMRPAEEVAEVAEHNDRQVVSFNKMDLELGRGLDVGTVNICASARRQNDDEIVYNIQRNAFLDVRSDTFTKKMLMKLGIDYIVQGDKGYVIGDPAFELANIFEKNTRRPMKDGMISPVEPEALLIVSLLIAELLGHPQTVGEVCAFSVPADPIDAERNVIYHRGALETVLRKIGYTPKPMLEGHSVVFAELQEQDYTGIGISCGGGMFNVCVAYKSVPAITFSTSRGGDWIDNNVATALGMPMSLVCAVKEGGVDLMNPKDRVQDAIVIYYRSLIQYTLETIKQKLAMAQNLPSFSKPIDVVCAGGTSLITGFIDVFRDEFTKVNLPIDVANVRLARDPLRSVAAGCLQAAIEETKALLDIQLPVVPAKMERSAITQTNKADDGTKRRLAMSRISSASVNDRAKPTKIEKMDIPTAPTESVTARADSEKIVRMNVPLAPAGATTSSRADSEKIIQMKIPVPPALKDQSISRAEPSKVEQAKARPELLEVEELPTLDAPPPKKKAPPPPDDDREDIPLIS